MYSKSAHCTILGCTVRGTDLVPCVVGALLLAVFFYAALGAFLGVALMILLSVFGVSVAFTQAWLGVTAFVVILMSLKSLVE